MHLAQPSKAFCKFKVLGPGGVRMAMHGLSARQMFEGAAREVGSHKSQTQNSVAGTKLNRVVKHEKHTYN